MRLDCEFETFKALMPHMEYIWVEESETLFKFLGEIEGQDLVCEYPKSEYAEDNIAFISNNFQRPNVFKVIKISSSVGFDIVAK